MIRIRLLLFCSCFIWSSLSHAAIVGPVNVLTVSDGIKPAECVGGMGAVAGGIAEMSLDLDQDGVVDVCFGSYDTACGANFNFDAYTANGTILSTQDDVLGNSIMGGVNPVTLAFWNGQPVGPNFQAASGSTSSANIGQPDEPLVFGFRGGSNTATTEYGQFSFTVHSADCSITFGSVDYQNGSNTYSSIVAAVTSVATIPTLSFWGVMLLSGLLAYFGLRQQRKLSDGDIC